MGTDLRLTSQVFNLYSEKKTSICIKFIVQLLTFFGIIYPRKHYHSKLNEVDNGCWPLGHHRFYVTSDSTLSTIMHVNGEFYVGEAVIWTSSGLCSNDLVVQILLLSRTRCISLIRCTRF